MRLFKFTSEPFWMFVMFVLVIMALVSNWPPAYHSIAACCILIYIAESIPMMKHMKETVKKNKSFSDLLLWFYLVLTVFSLLGAVLFAALYGNYWMTGFYVIIVMTRAAASYKNVKLVVRERNINRGDIFTLTEAVNHFDRWLDVNAGTMFHGGRLTYHSPAILSELESKMVNNIQGKGYLKIAKAYMEGNRWFFELEAYRNPDAK